MAGWSPGGGRKISLHLLDRIPQSFFPKTALSTGN